MAYRYTSFSELEAAERPGSFRVEVLDRGSALVVAAPHGGSIEPGTSEVALAIARDDVSCYRFEGRKRSHNRHLHLTSTNFDEPRGLALFASAHLVLTVHGVRCAHPVVYVGGLHRAAKTALERALGGEGFRVEEHPAYRGEHPRNVCNHGRGGAGVQLELSEGPRQTFFRALTPSGRTQSRERLHQFASVVRTALAPHAVR